MAIALATYYILDAFSLLIPQSRKIHGSSCRIIDKFQYLRYQEVLEFLRQNNALDDLWVAIDDIPEHYPPNSKVIVTDAYNGFDAYAALALELHLSAA